MEKAKVQMSAMPVCLVVQPWSPQSTKQTLFVIGESLFQKDTMIEEPCSKLQGMFCLTAVLRRDRKEGCHFMIRPLTPQQATGNALAIAVHHWRFTIL